MSRRNYGCLLASEFEAILCHAVPGSIGTEHASEKKREHSKSVIHVKGECPTNLLLLNVLLVPLNNVKSVNLNDIA